MTKKRVLAALLALCLLVGMLPLSAGATEPGTPGGDGDTPPAGEKKVLTVEGPKMRDSEGGTLFDYSIRKDYDGTTDVPDTYFFDAEGNDVRKVEYIFSLEDNKQVALDENDYEVNAKFDSKNFGYNKTVTYTITLKGNAASKYCFEGDNSPSSTTFTRTATILKRQLNLKGATATSREYKKGDSTIELTNLEYQGEFVAGEDVKIPSTITGIVGIREYWSAGAYHTPKSDVGSYQYAALSKGTEYLEGNDKENYIFGISTPGNLQLAAPVSITPATREVAASIAKAALDPAETTKVTVSSDNASGEDDFAGTGNKYTYASSNTAVATVDAAGNVTAKGPGTAKITVTAPATKNFAAGTKEVDVKVKTAVTLALTADVTDEDTPGGNQGDPTSKTRTVTLTVTGAPEGATINVACEGLTVTPVDGQKNKWTATITDLAKEYTFTAAYKGDDNYAATSASCKVTAEGTTAHVHTWAGTWTSDANNHWHACSSCDEKKDSAAHNWGEGVVTTEPTTNTAGLRTYTCSVCKATKTENIPATGGSTGNQGSSGGGTTTTTPKDEVTTTPTVSGGTASTTVSSSDGASLVEAAKQPGTGEVTVKVDTTQDVTAANVTLPVSTVTGVGAANTDLKIETPVADITLPSETLTGLGSGASSVTVSAAVNDDKTVSIDVKKDNTTVTALAQPMKAAIPAPDITGTTVAVLVNEDGTETIIPKSISGKDEISLLLGGSAKIKLKDNGKAFNDTKGHWADSEGAVGFVSSRELFKGTTDTSFSPETTMTRGMMVTVLHRLESTPKGGSVSFGDVSADAYFAEAVAWGNANDIVKGDGSNFLPDDNVTREQMATFLYRYASKYGVDTAGRTNLTSFPDSGNVSGYAKDALEWAYHTGLIKGGSDGKLNPTGSAKRGEVAAILMRFVEYINK